MKKKSINIGLYDMDFFDLNFGVNALGICHVIILNRLAKETNTHIRFTIFTPESKERVIHLFESILNETLDVITVRPISIRHPEVFWNFYKEVKKCDFIIDATGGDSFADIYGNTRIIRGTIAKFVMIKQSRLVLAPQTIGPFNSKYNEKLAVLAMNRAIYIFVRDKMSYDYIKKIAPKAKLQLASDVAFSLPYNEAAVDFKKTDQIDLGINVSGLLWKGGYTGDNQFSLSLDYAEYMMKILERFSSDEKYRVHLIAHVIEEGAYEDDYSVCKELSEKYPRTILAPKFTNPIEAKNYICHMNVFIGARMHATIGSFSSEIPTIPVAYSRKFEGVFGSIGYDINIDCKKLNTEEAIILTSSYIEDYKTIHKAAGKSLYVARQRIEDYENVLRTVIMKLRKDCE